ncbi:MAG: ribosome biogenesis GTP-binding protein YihA/YsxC [Burkholderiales bacterium]
MSPFSRATFSASVSSPEQLPPQGGPELAFAGRSNVGKSSAINALAKRKRLAFVSRTPGRTRSINFFDLGGRGWLVDLPGYGYARAPRALRAEWESLVGGYFSDRRSLAGVVVLMDARRPLTDSDLQLLEWLKALDAPRLVLLSKSDKLARAERAAALGRTRRALQAAGMKATVMLFSSTQREGVDEARALLEDWLAGPEPNKKPPAKGNATGGKAP